MIERKNKFRLQSLMLLNYESRYRALLSILVRHCANSSIVHLEVIFNSAVKLRALARFVSIVHF